MLVRVPLREPFELCGDGDGPEVEQSIMSRLAPSDLGVDAIRQGHYNVTS